MADPRPGIAAGLTLYRPDWPIFEALLDRLLDQANAVFVVVDGPIGEAIEAVHLARLRAREGVTLLDLRANAGIATGLNRLVEAARNAGFGRLVLFDQDSEVEEGLVCRLEEGSATLRHRGFEVAVIGPRPVAAPGSRTRAPRYRPRGERVGDLTAVDFVIVSGSLVDLRIAERIGPFDESLRMDGVDVEWGFRAWAKGSAVFVHEGTQLNHRVGTGLVQVGPIAFPRQSQNRMENYVRSQILLACMRHVPLRWKLRSLLYVPLQCIAFALDSGRPLQVLRRLSRAGLASARSRPPKDHRL